MNGRSSNSKDYGFSCRTDVNPVCAPANSRAPRTVRGRRSERGGTAARVMFVFFLIGVLVLFLLLRGCYKMAKSTYDSAHKSFSGARSNRLSSKPRAKTPPCPNLDP